MAVAVSAVSQRSQRGMPRAMRSLGTRWEWAGWWMVLLGGGLGLLLAYVAAWTCDWYSANRIPDFPFKPETYFVFSPGLIVASIGFAVLFCLIGAFLPADRGARMEPAAALTMR